VHEHHEVRIAACPDYVWAVLTDVSRWPEWSPSLREVVPFDGGPLVAGGGVRVRARRLPVREWQVTELRPHRGFTWTGSGVFAAARLRVGLTVQPPGATIVAFTLEHSGAAAIVGRMAGPTAATPVGELADGLRRRCESGQGRPTGVPGVAEGTR
jgi:Polyketide cyclase / dehydrase and lipid transport